MNRRALQQKTNVSLVITCSINIKIVGFLPRPQVQDCSQFILIQLLCNKALDFQHIGYAQQFDLATFRQSKYITEWHHAGKKNVADILAFIITPNN